MFVRDVTGGATVLACSALVGLITVTVLIGQVGAVVVARHRAQAAADLGALAGAGALEGGVEAGCAAAGEIAGRMKFHLEGCEVSGWDVTLKITEKIPMGLFGVRTIRAIARAGPAEEVDPATEIP
nr:Rv3654c family TadE-like protein [Nocardia panacis]